MEVEEAGERVMMLSGIEERHWVWGLGSGLSS